MPSLLDIAPPEIVTERFDIRGGCVEVRAIRNREWAVLMKRFPQLRKVMLGGGSISAEEIALDSLDMLPAVIAAALGKIEDKATEDALSERLTDVELIDIFTTVLRLTNAPDPLAVSPAIAGQAGNGKDPATTQRRSSN